MNTKPLVVHPDKPLSEQSPEVQAAAHAAAARGLAEARRIVAEAQAQERRHKDS